MSFGVRWWRLRPRRNRDGCEHLAAPGARAGPHELQLLIGLRTTEGAELAGLNGVTVTYVLDGKRITEDFPGAMRACAGSLDGACADRDTEVDMRQLGLLK